jgi:hypothetical protein
MSRLAREFANSLKEINHFSVHNLGNYLQSIYLEQKFQPGKLKKIFDLHWLERLGVDIYAKTLPELTIQETLFAMGRILYVNFLLFENGAAELKITAQYYQIIAFLVRHHDHLQNNIKKESKNTVLSINSSTSDDDDIIFSEPSRSYLSLPIHETPVPDPDWWRGLSDGMSHHHDPLMMMVSPRYLQGEVWGYMVKLPMRSAVQLINLEVNTVHEIIHFVPQILGEVKDLAVNGFHGIESGIDVTIQAAHSACSAMSDCCTGLGQALIDCLGGACHCLYGVVNGVCNGMSGCFEATGNCLSGCEGIICNLSSCSCQCGECRDGGGELCGCCGSIVGAIATCCAHICCGCCSPEHPNDGGGGMHGIHHYGLAKTGLAHLSISTSQFFAPTVGTFLTGAYALVFGAPVIYNLWHSAVKLIRGGERSETRSRDRKASFQDLVVKSSLGAGLFFGGLLMPLGGPHTALSFGIMGTFLGDKISKKLRKDKESQTYGGYPRKAGKYVPTGETMEKLYYSDESVEQPGLPQTYIAELYQNSLNAVLRNCGDVNESKNLPGRSRVSFLAAQRRLDDISYVIKNCAETAADEKTSILQQHGLSHGFCGLLRSYGGLFEHHRQTELRKNMLATIASLHKGVITECAQGFKRSS